LSERFLGLRGEENEQPRKQQEEPMAKLNKLKVAYISLVKKPANKRDIVYKSADNQFNQEKEIRIVKSEPEGLVAGGQPELPTGWPIIGKFGLKLGFSPRWAAKKD